MTYRIVIGVSAAKALRAISDRRVRNKLAAAIDKLRIDPNQQGNALRGELAGYRSLRAVGQRYRIVYRVKESEVIVAVLTVGIRKEGDKRDVYRSAEKLARESPPTERE